MRNILLGILLLATVQSCGSGRTINKGTNHATTPGSAQAEDPFVAPPTQVPREVALHPTQPEPEPQPSKKTEEQLRVDTRDRLDLEKRVGAAQDTISEHAEVKVRYGGLLITLSNSVLFESDQVTLRSTSGPMMKTVADALLVTSERTLTVEGHTDNGGTTESNIELSRHSAAAVCDCLIANGYPANLITSRGVGDDHPVSNNASAQGRANNRRVEILVDFKPDELL